MLACMLILLSDSESYHNPRGNGGSRFRLIDPRFGVNRALRFTRVSYRMYNAMSDWVLASPGGNTLCTITRLLSSQGSRDARRALHDMISSMKLKLAGFVEVLFQRWE